MTTERQKPGHPDVTINLLPGTKRLSITRGFELLAKAGLPTTIGFYSRGDGEPPALAVHGPLINPEALPRQFLEYCETYTVDPIDPSSPWRRNSYTGEGRQNDIFEITLDQYRAFAEGYGVGVEIGMPHNAATKAANDELTDAATVTRHTLGGTDLSQPLPKAGEQAWGVTKPVRPDNLGWQLYLLLTERQSEGASLPMTAREVLDRWRTKLPPNVVKVTDDTVDFLNDSGVEKGVDLRSLADRIRRMTT